MRYWLLSDGVNLIDLGEHDNIDDAFEAADRYTSGGWVYDDEDLKRLAAAIKTAKGTL